MSVDPDLSAMNVAGRSDAAGHPVAEARSVSKRYGATQALSDVTLAVEAGSTHALVGRNGAGKSTLVSILTGLTRPDIGEVRFSGAPAPPYAHRERWRSNVACVYQRSTVIPNLTVAENVFLNAYPNQRRGFVKWQTIRRDARALLEEWGVDVDVDRSAAALTVGQKQLVEIVRALRLGSRYIILDEPTAQLEAREISLLFEHMNRLRDSGVSFLYISHHLEEVYEMCQTLTVLRDGRLITTAPVAETSRDDLVRAMVGEAASTAKPTPSEKARDQGATPRLEVRDLCVPGWCTGIEFDLWPGERLGLAGLAGSGKAQVADAIVGILETSTGSVRVDGRELALGRVDRAIASGLGYVPQDRHARGFAPNLSVEENVTLSVMPQLGRAGVISPARRGSRARRLIDALNVVTSSPRQLVSQLSGGNQQKTVLGRALASSPRALVLVSPTAGVDIASKTALYETIRTLPDVGVLLVSDELDELAMCDRVLVMFDGKIVREFTAGWRDDDLVAAMEGVDRA